MNAGKDVYSKKKILMRKDIIVLVVIVFIIVSIYTACSPITELTTVTPRHPFSMEIMGEDGMQVSLEGYTDGYLPGATEQMLLGVKNNTGQPWPGRICISLLEPRPSHVVFPLAERKFTLDSGEGFEDTVDLELPTGISPGFYGLALVVQRPTGPTVNVTSIQVGEEAESQPPDAWPSEAALNACQ